MLSLASFAVFKWFRRNQDEGCFRGQEVRAFLNTGRILARGPESWATLMRKKGKTHKWPWTQTLTFLRQKQKRIINKTKCAWTLERRPAGLCQLDNPRSRTAGPELALGDDLVFTQAEGWQPGPREAGFSWRGLGSGQLRSGLGWSRWV